MSQTMVGERNDPKEVNHSLTGCEIETAGSESRVELRTETMWFEGFNQNKKDIINAGVLHIMSLKGRRKSTLWDGKSLLD